MLKTHSLPKDQSPADRNQVRGVDWQVIAIAAAALLAHAPLLIRHAAWLWIRPHYQFFPLVIVGAIVLAYTRMRSSAWQAGSVWVAGFGIGSAWLLLAAAVTLDSGWLACLAFMTLLPSLIYALGGREACRQFLPAWVLLWLIVPLPFDLDRMLIFALQNLTTGWSSAMLDALGVYHVQNGNVIEVDGRKMMVEQACSGINSLFSISACTIFLIFSSRRGWVRGGLLVAAAIAWVLAANVARVVGVVLADSRGINLAVGWRHEAFGLFIFLATIVLLLSTDQLLAFLSPTSSTSNRPTQPRETPGSTTSSTQQRGLFSVIVVTAYLILVVVQWATADSPEDASAVPAVPAPDQELLPLKLGAWERKGFATHNRDANNFFGEHSRVWAYSRGRATVLLSVDEPFPSWHDLTWCYTGCGWEIDEVTIRDAAEIPGGAVAVQMRQPVNKYGFLLFCEFDRSGQPLKARTRGAGESQFRHERSLNRLLTRFGLGGGGNPDPDPAGPVYQFQAFAEGFSPFTTEDQASVWELFLSSQALVRQEWNRSR